MALWFAVFSWVVLLCGGCYNIDFDLVVVSGGLGFGILLSGVFVFGFLVFLCSSAWFGGGLCLLLLLLDLLGYGFVVCDVVVSLGGGYLVDWFCFCYLA